MMQHKKRYTSKIALGLVFIAYSCYSYSQDAYMNMMDTVKGGLFKNFIGVKFYATGISANSMNQDLQLQYTSNNLGYQYIFQHDMNVSGINEFYNIQKKENKKKIM